MWNCEDCQPNSEWIFQEATDKLKVITNTGKIFNDKTRKAPATLAWLKNGAEWHFNNLVVDVKMRAKEGSKSGSTHITVLTKDALNFVGFAVSFNLSKKKNE